MHTLPPEMERLVELGLMSRAEAEESDQFMDALADAVTRGEITLQQAKDLGAMLGLHDAERTVKRAS